MTHPFIAKVNKYHELLSNPRLQWVLDIETTLIPSDKYKTVYNCTPKYIMHGFLNVGLNKSFLHDNVANLVHDPYALTDMIIGHNLSFDLWIAFSYMVPSEVSSKNLFIWDTMLAEYLLTNQVERMPSLEKCCENYGIPMQKEDEVSNLIKSGVCPSVIDKAKLKAYLEIDLQMTKEVFLKQKEIFESKPKQWQNMFINQMFFLLNTLRASWNGMKIDENFVQVNKVNLSAELSRLEGWLGGYMEGITGVPFEHWNPASNKDLTVFLYGGVKEWTEREQVGVYKTGLKVGLPRWKLNKRTHEIYGDFTDRGSVDESALKDCLENAKISVKHAGHRYIEFLEKLLKYKDISKNYNTYFEGYMNFATEDGYINPKYNHGLTPTGRLTCSGPNLQNIKG